MSYKCPSCGEIFDEPVYEEVCLEVYNGVASLFPNNSRHYATFVTCPFCNCSIDKEDDAYDEDADYGEEYEDE